MDTSPSGDNGASGPIEPASPLSDDLSRQSAPPGHPNPPIPSVTHGHQSFWLWIMCLTGVDYFSTLGYQPSIAFDAAGVLAPLATLLLVGLTLFGALPVYSYVASKSPHGQGSIAMLEHMMTGWKAKAIVLVLLGFAATDFVITKTLSAADAAVHMLHNPFWKDIAPQALQDLGEPNEQILLTMFLLIVLGAVFLRGFREVIGLAVVIVGLYLVLNFIVIGSGIWYLLEHPSLLQQWMQDIASGNWHMEHGVPGITGTGFWTIIAICVIIFPKLALGLSGFETGVAVMPLIRGEIGDDPAKPQGRIRNTRKLLATAALIMAVLLLGSSLVTSTLIQPESLYRGGKADDRALAYLAHGDGPIVVNRMFGDAFGTLYDFATVTILSFAGASAMAGLLNLVPQYLPRYGMAPEWARAVRPLAILFTAINLFVTWIFDADVQSQGGAYATGVLVLISSACTATLIDRYRTSQRSGLMRIPWGYAVISAMFFYTTIANIIERPDGIKIASCFIIAIILSSLWSRSRRSTELRFGGFEFVNVESRFLWDSLKHLEFPVLVPHRPGGRALEKKEQVIRQRHRIPPEVPVVFIEAEVGDPSEFEHMPLMEIRESEGRIVIGVKRCVSVAHVIATLALELSRVGQPPEVHFGWSDENPTAASISFLLLGEGNVPWLVRELIRKAEPNPSKQPKIFIG